MAQVGVDECVYSDCSHAGGCTSMQNFGHTPAVISGGNTALVSISASVRAQCGCSARESLHLSCASYPRNPCLNGGTCADSELGYRCKCLPMFEGPECQQTKHTFHGHGYAWFPPIRPCFQSHISIEFITESANGLLLYNGPMGPLTAGDQEDFIVLELRNGVPALTVNHGSGTLTLQLPAAASITDRRWHRLDITSDGKTVQLVLDRCAGVTGNEVEGPGAEVLETDQSICRASGETPGAERFLNLNQPLQLGGVKEAVPHWRTHPHLKGFTGCLRNLVVDSQVYDLGHPSESLNSAPGCGLTDGACVTARGPSCGVHGKCQGQWGSFSCDCLPGFSGHKCDKGILDGQLSVQANLGNDSHTLRLTSQRVDSGQWVLLSLLRHDNLFTLQLEQGGGAREISAALGHKRQAMMHVSSLVIGNSASHGQHKDFQGCVRDVRLNGRLLPLDGQRTEFSAVLERRGLQLGCHSDACRSRPCHSPLYCVDLWRKHECRCPADQLTVVDEISGLQRCTPSPCGSSTCRNGGTCLSLSPQQVQCRCPEGFRGQLCEVSHVTAVRLAALSPSSILAISMCLLVFFAVLVAVTVWNQKGTHGKFQRRGVYHIPAEHESWEDNAYDITELKRPLCSSLSQSSSCTTAPLIKSAQGSQEEVHPTGLGMAGNGIMATAYLHAASCPMDFSSYISRIIWEADRDSMALPSDTYHVYCIEGVGTPAGSLSSLESAVSEEDFTYDSLHHWGS
ncbi:hypothetical protein JZ751_015681, partial [Albula glossodonta]